MTEQKQVIPEGYKQTEVGVIPIDWKAAALGDIAEVRMCKRILSWQTQKTGAIPFFKIGTFGSQPDAYIPTQLYDEFKAKYSYPNEGDILISAAGTLGKSVIYDGKPAYFQDSNIVWLEVDKKSLLNEYLFHYYKIIKWASSEGSTIARLYNGIIRASLITLPSVKEQTAIANALSDVDALISELEKLIAKKQAIKTATMQQLLTGKTRLPEFALREDGTPKGYKQSELGEIPEDWEVAPLRDFIKIRHGRNQKAVESPDGKYPIFATGGQIGTANSFLYDKPSVLIGRKGTIDKPRYTEEPFWTVDTLFYSEVSKTADAKFMFYKVCMIDWMQYSEASGVPSLNASTIESVLAVFPERDEQIAIATVLSDIDKEIKTLQQRLNKTRQIKQGMMQELLTGKTRLVKPEVTA
ncbi:restriction endonuclease subunit S [Tolumonas osonensis]|uniref:Type I restriction enzyme S subunit n=1 Tax=Tolumonas osonensis TaxID=675874 RepID=A0A841GCP2_9GAMM|nr:restriction endonuclease subunit S [Tolumonas osonensis]MBB6055367.1 type I restriction enzyme S subunit [Tolumonas osonensis]